MLRFVVVMTGKPGSPWVATHFLNGVTQEDANQGMAQVNALWTGLGTQMATGVTITIDSFVAVVDPVTGDVTGGFTATGPYTTQSSNAATPVPNSSQGLAIWDTGFYALGRRVRGKTFIPRLIANYVTANGQVDPGAITTIKGFTDTFVAGPLDVLVWSRKLGRALPVTTSIVSDEWAILASRRD